MELFKEVEEKFEQIRNPSSYLKTAAARENPSSQGRGMPLTALALAPFTQRRADADPATKIHRRASWLNANVFPDRHIDPEALPGPECPRNCSFFLRAASFSFRRSKP